MPGLLISAPASGSGKTTVTLGILRALTRSGHRIASAKAGPDYIDPAFHAAATGRSSVNLDPWAMRPALVSALAAEAVGDADGLVVEGMMGLFDAGADGKGSTADLAAMLGLGVVLVIDCTRQSHSVAALVRGFRDHRADLHLSGLVLNRTGSARHETLLRDALAPLGVPVLGALPARADLVLPERHLGLVQAGEHIELDAFLDRAADWVEEGLDMRAVQDLASGFAAGGRPPVARLPPFGQRIAVARDAAFAFSYPHILAGWRQAGAELRCFSPLADEAPHAACDAVYLPGGYPELNAGRLSAAETFKAGLRRKAAEGAAIYGECGGYMVLGETIEDARGARHPMLGLLPLETSFRAPKRHLGYRRAELLGVPWRGRMTAHEFHYASVMSEGAGEPFAWAQDALGNDLGAFGLRVGRVAGSFLHLIDCDE